MIIGITGFKTAGKSTFAAYLALEIDRRKIPVSQVTSFATPIRGMLRGIDVDPWEKNATIPGTTVTIRDAMRGIGQGMRAVCPDFWVQLMLVEISKPGNRVVIIDDVRMANEAAICDAIIRINRPGVESDGHETEKMEWWEEAFKSRKPAWLVDNNSDLAHLSRVADILIDDLQAKGLV